MNTATRKIIIDTDPGIDDAMAIFFALASPEFEVLALTTVFGNAHASTCTINALRLLEIAGCPEILVAHGAEVPLASEFRGPAGWVHGDDGQGNTNLPQASAKPVEQSAAQLIVDLANTFPGEITLVPLGPLTNVALAMQIDPQLDQKLDQIVLMGGNAFCRGNASAAAEANIFNDPEAADIVFGLRCPIVMVGLDVTETIHMNGAHLARIAAIDNAPARHAAKILPFYADFHVATGRGEVPFTYVHDSTTISYLLAPQHFEWVDMPIRVDCANGVCRGKTLPQEPENGHDPSFAGRPKVRILTKVDADAVIELELERLAR